jgi:hypothetical protein
MQWHPKIDQIDWGVDEDKNEQIDETLQILSILQDKNN